mmetsp:Transcript_29665/g.34926  ORF Transcript_29665/g.34926 Transcript_29665/m.34926 type:complete len:395 (-) Transcript_29665:121-1305(-)
MASFHANTSIIPDKIQIPVDEADCRFTQSFAVDASRSKEAESFFNQFGFIIFKDVIEPSLCKQVRCSMWSHLEDTIPGFHQKDNSTWHLWPGKGFGMSGKSPVFSTQTLELRQNSKVYESFSSIMNYKNNNDSNVDIVCSHDRWILYRKTMGIGPIYQERPDWRTKRNVHLDMNPWEYHGNPQIVYNRINNLRYSNVRDFITENNEVSHDMGICVQGIINLKDNFINDGGTIVVPGSHLTHRAYFNANPNIMKCEGPMQFPSCHEHKNSEIWSDIEQRAQRVCLQEGSLLIWDQRLVHGSSPNMSHSNRFGFPIRFFKKSLMTQERSEARAFTLMKQINEINFGPQLSNIGRKVFGLEGTHAEKLIKLNEISDEVGVEPMPQDTTQKGEAAESV